MTTCTLNFEGSAYQMFPGRVILMEKSDLEAERVALFESVMKNQRSMKELESNLLCRLTSTQVCTEYYFAFFSTVHTFYGTIKRVHICREYSNSLKHLTLCYVM